MNFLILMGFLYFFSIFSLDAGIRQASLEVDPRVRFLNDSGAFFYQKGCYQDALAHFTLAVELDSRSVHSLVNRSSANIKLRSYSEAIDDASRALELTPNSVQAHNNLGNAYAGLGKKKKALFHYKSAYRLDNNFLEVIFNIANFYYQFNAKSEAIRYYNRAILLNPNLIQAYIFRAVALHDLGHRERSREDFKRVLQMSVRNIEEGLRFTLAQALFKTENYIQAENVLVKVIEEDPMHDEAYVLRAQVRYELKNYYDAYEDIETAFKIKTDVKYFPIYNKIKNKIKKKLAR